MKFVKWVREFLIYIVGKTNGIKANLPGIVAKPGRFVYAKYSSSGNRLLAAERLGSVSDGGQGSGERLSTPALESCPRC